MKIPVGVAGIRDAQTAQTLSRFSDAIIIGSKIIPSHQTSLTRK